MEWRPTWRSDALWTPCWSRGPLLVARNSAVAPCLRIIIGKLANSSYIMGGGTLLEYAAVGVAAPHLQTFVVSLVPPPQDATTKE